MKKDQPEYDPKSLSDGGGILEQIPFAGLTAKERDFIIIVYRFTFGFQRFWSLEMKKGKWATLMGLTPSNFWKIKKSLEKREIVLSRENKNLLTMRIERHKEKWKVFSPERSRGIEKKFSPERTKLLSPENSTSLQGEQEFSPQRSMYRDEFKDKDIDKVLDKGEVSPSTPSFFQSSFKEETPEEKTSESSLFSQDQIKGLTKGIGDIPRTHRKRSQQEHRKILEQQRKNLELTGRAEG